MAVIATLLATAWAAWAAGAAARAANRSLDLFQSAEGGQLAPHLVVNAYDVITLSLRNVGRSGVVILHADVCCVEKPPDKPIGTFLSGVEFPKNVMIEPEKPYVFGEGPMQIQHENPECWIYGGAIYRTVFGKIDFVGIAIFLDRTTGRHSVDQTISFTEWHSFAKRVQKIK